MSAPARDHVGLTALGEDLARHAAFGDKRSGSAGDLATAAWIHDRLQALGMQVQTQSVPVPYFEPTHCELATGDVVMPVFAQPPVCSTPPGGLRAPLVAVRAPFEAAGAAGAIALLVLPHARHASLASPLIAPLVDAARAAGAAALVLVPTGPSGEMVALNCPMVHDATTPPLPMAVLAPKLAGPLLQAAHAGLAGTLVLQGRHGQRETPNLIGRLVRGPRWLCLSTPRTGWFTCAGERGTGTAALLATTAWSVGRWPDVSLCVLNTGAHEFLFAGAAQALALAPTPEATAVWAHFGASLAVRDGFTFRGRPMPLRSADPRRFTMATAALQAAAEVAFDGLPGLEGVAPPVPGVSELGEIAAHGHIRAFAALGIHAQFHTPADDARVVDAALLAPVVRAHQALIDAALRADELARTAANAAAHTTYGEAPQ